MKNLTGKNKFLINPKTNTFSFGKIPEIKNKRYIFQSGEIYLRQGEHRGINRGFGVEHIWEAHKKELIESGYNKIEDVPRFVSDIVHKGSLIFCEFEGIGKHRISVVASSKGIAYLEERQGENNEVFYSVVTAFLATKKHGTLIGTVSI